jgi:RNA polymerase sigma-70 factor (ECF subfamily)
MEDGFTIRDNSHQSLGNIIDSKQVYRLLAELDETYRPIVIMRFIDELSPKEIALVLGLSENVVSVRLNRGIKKLRARATPNT